MLLARINTHSSTKWWTGQTQRMKPNTVTNFFCKQNLSSGEGKPTGRFQLCSNSLGKALYFPAFLYPCAQSKVRKDMVRWVCCEGAHLACTEPWPHHHWTPLGGITTLIVSQAFPSNINAWPHKCSFGWMGTNSHRHAPKFCWKSSQKSSSCFSNKGEWF